MSNDFPQVVFWEDRPIAGLSREELIEVINFLAAEHRENYSPKAIKIRVLGSIELMRRGEA